MPEPEELVLPTLSPVLMFTAATVPVIVERSVPSARSALAALRLLLASATCASADATWLEDDPDSAEVSASSAAVRLAWARVTCADRSLVPTRARACPLRTLSPTETGTAVTVPLTAKDRSASCAGSMVPVVLTLWLTVEVDTVTVVVVAAGAEEPRVAAQATPPPAQSSTTRAPATAQRRRPANRPCTEPRSRPAIDHLSVVPRGRTQRRVRWSRRGLGNGWMLPTSAL